MNRLIVIFLTILFQTAALAGGTDYLKNSWTAKSRYLPSKLVKEITNASNFLPVEILHSTIEDHLAGPDLCSVDFARDLFGKAVLDRKAFLSISKWRYDNLIDDLFYRQLSFVFQVETYLQHEKADASDFSEKKAMRYEKKYELRKGWAKLPNSCVSTVFNFVQTTTSNPWGRKKIIHTLRKLGIINDRVFGSLEFARKNKRAFVALEIRSYLEKLKKVKGALYSERKKIEDKYTRSQDGEAPLELANRPESENEKTQKASKSFFIKHFEKNQTLHEIIYTKYTAEQIVVLASIILNASKRIEADSVSINFDFDLTVPDDQSIYVLSPMEKYRLSIRMLELDLKKASLAFKIGAGNIRYEELVYASMEAGVLKENELIQVLKFEEFWNPKNPEWKKYVNFVLSFSTTASLALPFPYNFIAAGALGLIQSTFFRQKKPKNEEHSSYGIF